MTPAELKTARTELGLSQAALASVLGVRRATVADWERGVHAIPDMLALALEALKARSS